MKLQNDGISFRTRVVLITGCGKGSIGEEILEGLLSGGARVIVTTSSYKRKTVEYFQRKYTSFGCKGEFFGCCSL